MRTPIVVSLALLSLIGNINTTGTGTFLANQVKARNQWTVDQANQWWQQSGGWFAGCNFIPSTAVNTLEMWQAETYDPTTIDRELGFAASAGFKVIRVFIHHLVWNQDRAAFKSRLDNFLSIADKHGIKTMFAMFDDCWNPEGHLGQQPAPIQGVHNSQWVRAPGYAEFDDTSLFPLFQEYFHDIIGSLKNDKRVYLWDIYNEPGNSGHGQRTLPLLQGTFQWAREAEPSQPISSAPWNFGSDFDPLTNYQFENSDVITFHLYSDLQSTQSKAQQLKARYQKPVILSEYMARPTGSKFQTHIPMLHDENVGAINWGLVSGKTNTIFPWGSPEGSPEPKIWFHDVFRKDGTPFDQEEIDVLRKYTQGQSTRIELNIV
ncbi:cellulase (glycosyl hydrolase family 5) [Stylonychia lemnae]|uniref:Cellulase (Glycosyl hydrolase family 5) n=1 Tax=Stylonychia lemnae TaxID=5949 RepID=A0A078A0I1_STYLE|nr:cellulase (glycosyl hydrolase family 5) [Stylonychia lemnae]|eukprot:CDW74958.1 cellulase (glycosyl hydrolase family 5) [Stylonychia lemnae]